MGWNLTTNILANPNYQMKSSQILQNYLNTVPEPSTWALLIAGFGFVGAAMRRRVATAVTA
ncbi:PEPxxWA-CTERM sorting domain-containing protein [Polymorphobacter megasporae]|nr:PEPxxWA-CTERM sorting domain-containing protein [Polymorphobacter megasporae]